MKFTVEKMMCGGCVSNVKNKLAALDGVTSVEVDLDSKTATVEGDIDEDTVIETLTAAGYPAEAAD